MRRREFGKFTAEFADFSGRSIRGTSIIIDGHSSNSDNGGWNLGTAVVGDSAWRLAAGGTGEAAKSLHTIKLAALRAELGHTPVLLRARLFVHMFSYDGSYPTGGTDFGLFRVLPGRITQGQATYRYRATGVPYEGDGYSPVHGKDVAAAPFATTLIPRRTVFGYLDSFDVTKELLYNLRANTDMQFLMRWLPLGTKKDGAVGAIAYWNTEGKRPYLDIAYLQNLEFFAADPVTGAIDLSRLLDNTTGSTEDWLYLGALAQGEASTPVKFYLRNFGDRTFPLLTVMRRHPRWTVPVQAAGTGTGKLDYVVLADTAVWQKYTITFTSSTTYSVKAEAYRKNPVSLNPAGGGTGWTGSTAATWTAPNGGLTIPAAAWQPGTLVNDSFVFFVAGTDTDGSWPLDADDMVQITRDVGGAPDNAGWRSIAAAYTRSTAGVTIDAATKKIPTRAIIPSMWLAGTPAFIGDGANLDTGTVAGVDSAAIGTPTFSGSGLNDLTVSGNYNGTKDATYVVEIDGTGTPDTFRWSQDGGATWAATGVPITGSAQLLADGIHITFAATTGHTVGNSWSMDVTTWGVTLTGLAAGSNTYAAGAVVSTGLPVTSLAPGVWRQTTGICGASSTPANRIPLADTSGFSAGNQVTIQSIDNPAAIETVTVQAVTSSYLDVSSNLLYDYPIGSVVARLGTGEVAMWARVVATPSTAEEIKIFRIGVEA